MEFNFRPDSVFLRSGSRGFTRSAWHMDGDNRFPARFSVAHGPRRFHFIVPNRAIGSWTLVNEAGDVLLGGTWTAQKTGQALAGHVDSSPMKGQLLSGTWTADAASLNADSLAEMAEKHGNEGSHWLMGQR
jgi:hypothetical protein